MKKALASIMLLAFLTTGCTGSFNLTKKVYNFHRSQSDKWADELCFLLVAITPIYGIATLADAIVFNSIEFWSGENPIDMAKTGPNPKIVKQGDQELLMSFDPKTEQVMLMGKNQKSPLLLERNESMVLAKNEKGDTMYSSFKRDNGDIVILDAKGNTVKNFSANEVESLKEKYLK